MRKLNQILLIALAAVFLLSFMSYQLAERRAERFERGQKLLASLNPDEIAEVSIQKGDETTQLERAQGHFRVASANGYPASNESVNRLLRDLLEIGLEKEVGSGESLQEELAVSGPGEETTEIVLKDAAQKEMVRLLIGKAADSGGSYVRRADTESGEIYLSSGRIYLATDEDSFLQKEIVNVQQDEIAAIRGVDFEIQDQDGGLQLSDVPAGMREAVSKMTQVKGLLSGLRFVKHHLADSAELQGIRWRQPVDVNLKDDSGYRMAVGQKDDKYFLQIQAFHNVERLEVSPDDTEEQAEEKAAVLKRADEVGKFNELHGSWVYEITETAFEKIGVKRSDLQERA